MNQIFHSYYVNENMHDEVLKEYSLLGVKGLMKVYLNGNVNLINTPGTGIADDKAVYTYIPEIIKYDLGEEPILKNVQTYKCLNEGDC